MLFPTTDVAYCSGPGSCCIGCRRTIEEAVTEMPRTHGLPSQLSSRKLAHNRPSQLFTAHLRGHSVSHEPHTSGKHKGTGMRQQQRRPTLHGAGEIAVKMACISHLLGLYALISARAASALRFAEPSATAKHEHRYTTSHKHAALAPTALEVRGNKE
jgi:hypothetical protein